MNFWDDYRFQLDLLQLQFGRLLARPKFILFLILLGASLTLFDRPASDLQAARQVARARGASSPWEYQSALEKFNEAIALNPQMSEAYAGRGNLYLRWSHFLERAQTSASARRRAEALGFNLAMAPEYRKRSLADFERAFQLAQQQEDIELQQDVQKTISCLQKGKICYVDIRLITY
jgi:tetratricopeptide (TPR) repeat protein